MNVNRQGKGTGKSHDAFLHPTTGSLGRIRKGWIGPPEMHPTASQKRRHRSPDKAGAACCPR